PAERGAASSSRRAARAARAGGATGPAGAGRTTAGRHPRHAPPPPGAGRAPAPANTVGPPLPPRSTHRGVPGGAHRPAGDTTGAPTPPAPNRSSDAAGTGHRCLSALRLQGAAGRTGQALLHGVRKALLTSAHKPDAQARGGTANPGAGVSG